MKVVTWYLDVFQAVEAGFQRHQLFQDTILEMNVGDNSFIFIWWSWNMYQKRWAANGTAIDNNLVHYIHQSLNSWKHRGPRTPQVSAFRVNRKNHRPHSSSHGRRAGRLRSEAYKQSMKRVRPSQAHLTSCFFVPIFLPRNSRVLQWFWGVYFGQRKFGCETSELRTFKNAQSNRFVK